jgi:hypothetical protein
MTNTETITWRGEEWEVVTSVTPPYGTIALNDNQEALIIKRKPKPLREEYKKHPLWKFLQACRVHFMQLQTPTGNVPSELWIAAHDARDWLEEEIKAGRCHMREVRDE